MENQTSNMSSVLTFHPCFLFHQNVGNFLSCHKAVEKKNLKSERRPVGNGRHKLKVHEMRVWLLVFKKPLTIYHAPINALPGKLTGI